MNPKPSISRSNWKLRLRPRQTATTVQASPSQPAKRPYTTKKRKKNTEGQATKGKRFSARLSNGINLSKRKRLLDLSGSEGLKRVKLTQEALGILEASTASRISSLTSMPQASFSAPSSAASHKNLTSSSGKRSFSSTSSASRSYTAKDVRFEACLTGLNVNFVSGQQPDPDDVNKLLEVIESERDSPEPDSGKFYESLAAVVNENEAMVIDRLRPLLLPFRDLPSDNRMTKDLLYRRDVLLKAWGSVQPGYLPTPKPDICISFRSSAFSPDELTQITSPYQDNAGFYPSFICEVKTALQGPQIADRQNANNAISILIADYEVQQRLGLKMEKKVRLITTAHDTRSQWYTVWFFVLGTNGKPEWCSKVIKHYNFQIPEENGFRAARTANLNICEYLQRIILPQLQTDLAVVPESSTLSGLVANVRPPLTPDNSETDLTSKRARIAKSVTGTRPVTRSVARRCPSLKEGEAV